MVTNTDTKPARFRTQQELVQVHHQHELELESEHDPAPKKQRRKWELN